ncbi:DUF4870 domain-containing protein [bacterium]|nr:DUF4870 domain-containing protein [bacterium]
MDEVAGTPQPTEQVGEYEPTSDEKTMAILAHVLGILVSFVGPLIIWLIKKDESKFVDFHGKEALNFQITMAIAYIIGGALSVIGVGCIVMLAAWVMIIVFGIIAAVAANKGEFYKYPVTIRFIK